MLTGMQPYRCHQCDWRRWSRVTLRSRSKDETLPDELRIPGSDGAVKVAELDRLDPK